MIRAHDVSLPTGHEARDLHGLALLAWLLPMAGAAFSHTSVTAISADELGMYRYTADIIAYFRDDVPIGWIVQLGPRYFPDLPISFLAYALALGDARAWGLMFVLINMSLVYGAFLLLLRTSGVPAAERPLIGLAFMGALLLLAALSFHGAKNLLHTTHHNTLLAPMLLFYALPFRAGRAEPLRRLFWLIAGFGLLFGLVLHANRLFLIWAVLPGLAAVLVLAILGLIRGREIGFPFALTLAALTVGWALGKIFDALPFLELQEPRLDVQIRFEETVEHLEMLDQPYAWYGGTAVLCFYVLAATGATMSLLATRRGPLEARRLRVMALALFATTVLIVPAAMAAAGQISARYLFWAIAVAALPVALAGADTSTLLRLGPRAGTALFATVILVVGGPYFVAQAHQAAVRETPYVALMAALESEVAAGRVEREGLAHYWIAQKASPLSDFAILPLGGRARPFLLTANAFTFWDWRSGCPQPRPFTFVVTARSGLQRVDPAAIRERFGSPAEIVPVDGIEYEIWRYPGGIEAPDELYDEVVRRLEERKVSSLPLQRCDDPSPD